ncbi:MAG TPA: diaminobutyrate acetyltransferase [Smithellaceae bacterium]|nr:diaminobutyrate acetyltransferase [Smithellaceae bacterium]
MSGNSLQIIFRQPCLEDAKAIHSLIDSSPPLDVNSLYCYLLLCTHFAETSVVAQANNELCGFISAYVRPDDKETIFVWQVAVKKEWRKKGIAPGMLWSILRRAYPFNLRYLETTVNPSNKSSRNLFSSFAESLNSCLVESVLFSANEFGDSGHEKEILFRIGPFNIPGKENYSWK